VAGYEHKGGNMKKRKVIIVLAAMWLGLLALVVLSYVAVTITWQNLNDKLETTLYGPQAPPDELFKKYILSPIPASVTDIRADQPSKIIGYRFTFRFKINREDLALIINSRPFMRVLNVEYKNGYISWQWNRDGPFGTGPTLDIPCYDHTREPRWFRPGRWDNPEAYAFRKVGDRVNIETYDKDSRGPRGPTNIQVLLYNEEEAEAYFVVMYYEH